MGLWRLAPTLAVGAVLVAMHALFHLAWWWLLAAAAGAGAAWGAWSRLAVRRGWPPFDRRTKAAAAWVRVSRVAAWLDRATHPVACLAALFAGAAVVTAQSNGASLTGQAVLAAGSGVLAALVGWGARVIAADDQEPSSRDD